MKNRGFTLIELLVVIGIIALISSIVLGSLQDARRKARNSTRNSQMMEYAKAFMLYASDHGHFPKRGTPGADTNSALCLGFYPSNFCGLGSNPVSHGLAEDLKPYTSFPSVGPSIKFTTNETWTGALYNCHDSLTACKKARLIWLLEGENQTCARPANFNSSLQPSLYYGHTECRLEISVH